MKANIRAAEAYSRASQSMEPSRSLSAALGPGLCQLGARAPQLETRTATTIPLHGSSRPHWHVVQMQSEQREKTGPCPGHTAPTEFIQGATRNVGFFWMWSHSKMSQEIEDCNCLQGSRVLF